MLCECVKMSDESKKISFGFSKLSKPKVSIISNNAEVKKDDGVQFIDCLEDKSIKVKNEEPKKPDFLVIPLPKQNNANIKNSALLDKILSGVDNQAEIKKDNSSNSEVSTPQNSKFESLDDIAAKEIIEDLKKVKDVKEEQNNFSVPLTTNAPSGEKESSLEDYDSIPVDKFGFAMLRGMGWAPGKGIGKNEKVVATVQPVLRPKGLGLGADKVIKTEKQSNNTDEQIKLVKGSFVRIIAGVHKDLFGEVIGFDDETGRIIVKMTLGGCVVTFNEFMIKVISKEDFNKNCRVINVKKFEEYKSREDTSGVIKNRSSSEDSRKSSDKYSNVNVKSRHKSRTFKESSVPSSDSAEKIKVRMKSKHKSTDHYSSPQNSDNEEANIKSGKSKKYKSPSRDNSPGMYKNYNKSSSHNKSSKNKYYNSPDRSTPKHYDRHKELSTYLKHRSSSYDSSPTRSKTKIDKHTSRKDINKKDYHKSWSDSSTERYSSSTRKRSTKNRKQSSSTDSSSDESFRKRKNQSISPDSRKTSKKHKLKKKKRRKSRSSSREIKYSEKSSSSRKHKKSKKSK